MDCKGSTHIVTVLVLFSALLSVHCSFLSVLLCCQGLGSTICGVGIRSLGLKGGD